ncbi:MAG: hypothetical protein OXR62_11050 [Ahrensia sp.]|nr:hypothetical protein [Ahrensia sp.]
MSITLPDNACEELSEIVRQMNVQLNRIDQRLAELEIAESYGPKIARRRSSDNTTARRSVFEGPLL